MQRQPLVNNIPRPTHLLVSVALCRVSQGRCGAGGGTVCSRPQLLPAEGRHWVLLPGCAGLQDTPHVWGTLGTVPASPAASSSCPGPPPSQPAPCMPLLQSPGASLPFANVGPALPGHLSVCPPPLLSSTTSRSFSLPSAVHMLSTQLCTISFSVPCVLLCLLG